jgi:putative ABC transport system substrate-binding protein
MKSSHERRSRSKVTAMKVFISIWIGASVFLSSVALASAQTKKPNPRIGWVWFGPANSGQLPGLESAFVDGLRELNYLENRNFTFEHRFAAGQPERIPGLVKDLVRQNVDIIFALGGDLVAAAKQATKTVPIVFGVSEDPVRSGLVADLARPGGNLTGVTFLSDELAGKRVEVLKEIHPKLARLGVLWNPSHVDDEFKQIQTVAQGLGMKLTSHKAQRPEDFEEAFAAISKANNQALVVVPSRLTSVRREPIANFAKKNRMSMISGWREFTEAGGLASYGPNRDEAARRLAYYVDRILKGAKPSELPVELPTKFELVINLHTAYDIGVTIPPNVLARADRVIR